MRDRLVEILHEMPREMMIGEVADYLLANGVVEVVRCKDCKHWNETERQCENDYIVSDNEGGASFSINFYLDDFCSYGTPKERGGEK